MPGLENIINSIFESIDSGIMITDVDGVIREVNLECCKLLDYSKKELIGKEFTVVLVPHERKKAIAVYAQNFTNSGEEKLKTYWRLKRGDGEELLVTVSSFPIIPDEGGEYLVNILKKESQDFQETGVYNIHKAILKNVKDSVVVVRIDGTILYWNQGATDIYEYKEEEVLGKLIYNFWPEERFSQFVTYFALGNEKLDLFDSLHKRKDGEKVYVDFRITPFIDENDNLTGLIFFSQDVTGKYKSKKAIKDQRNMYSSLVDSQSNFLIRLDPTGKVIFVNKAFSNYFKFYLPIEGAYLEQHIFPEDIPVWKSVLEKLSQSAELQRIELRIVNTKNESIWTNWEFVGISDKNGEVNSIQAVGIDVSERKKVEQERDHILEEVQLLNKELQANEEELRQNLESTLELKDYIEKSEQKWKSLLENSFEVVLVFDENGFIQYASPAVQVILGFLPEEMVGKKGMFFVHEEDKPSTRKLLELVMEKPGEPVSILHRARKKDGEYIYIESYCTNLLADENVKGVVSNYRDITERVEGEEKLRNSEASLNLAQHIAKFGSLEFDLISGEIRQSTGLYAIYDFDLTKHEESEFIGYEYIHPEDVEKVRNFFLSKKEFGTEWIKDLKHLPEDRLEQLENHPFEYRIISATGKLKYIKSYNRIIRDESGMPVKSIITIQDVSEERHLEHLLEDTNRMAKIGGWELDLASYKFFLTSQIYRTLELPQGKEIVFGQELEFYHPDHRPAVKEATELLISNGIPYDLELKMITAKNKQIWVREIGWAEKVNNKVVLVKGIIQDITERKKAEKEIKKYAERLRLATETAGIGIWDWDIQKDEMVWDKQMRKNYNVSPMQKEVSYLDWKKALLPEDVDKQEIMWQDVLKNQKVETEFQIQSPSGELKWMKFFAKVFNDVEGNPKRMLGVNWDITRLKQTEEILRNSNSELIKINNELDHFVYSTSHNLRAPLTSILGIVELIKYSPKPEEFKEYIFLIEKSVKKLDETIQEITNYSRNARVGISAELIDFESLVQGMVESLSFLENANKITITYNTPAKFNFYSDLSRMKMIFTNILSNAIKYSDFSREDSYIKIQVCQNAEGAFISIKDNGIGIAPEYQEKIFDMFFRASTMSTGSGLGLYIVKEAVTKLKGTIAIDSTPGEGTEFKIYLPNLLKEMEG